MAQPTVFSQLIQLIPRSQFEGWVHAHRGDHGVKTLDCWTWFGALLFSQLSGHDSIRAVERVFAHQDPAMKRLGLGPVRRSTLADANCKRPLEILEKTFDYMLRRAQQTSPRSHGFDFSGPLWVLDSTLISLCLSLSPWAQFHKNRASIKLHTAIDLAGDLPTVMVLRPGQEHDLKIAKNFVSIAHGTTVVFDRAYVEYRWLNQLNVQGAYFVTREKGGAVFKVVESRPTDRTQGYLCDQLVYATGVSGRRYEGKLRRISYREPDTGQRLVFLTNRFDLDTKTICDLYRARWKVELFFKSLKQNLKIKKFLGTSANAVKAQIWVALIAYLMVQMLRLRLKSSISMPTAMAVIGTLLLLKEPLSRLMGVLPLVTRAPPQSQLSLQL